MKILIMFFTIISIVDVNAESKFTIKVFDFNTSEEKTFLSDLKTTISLGKMEGYSCNYDKKESEDHAAIYCVQGSSGMSVTADANYPRTSFFIMSDTKKYPKGLTTKKLQKERGSHYNRYQLTLEYAGESK